MKCIKCSNYEKFLKSKIAKASAVLDKFRKDFVHRDCTCDSLEPPEDTTSALEERVRSLEARLDRQLPFLSAQGKDLRKMVQKCR